MLLPSHLEQCLVQYLGQEELGFAPPTLQLVDNLHSITSSSNYSHLSPPMLQNLFSSLLFSFVSKTASHIRNSCTKLLLVTYSGMSWPPHCFHWQASKVDHCRAGRTCHSDLQLCGEYTDTYQTPGRHIFIYI